MKKLLFFVVMAFILIGFKPSPKAAAGLEPQMKVELKNYLANKTSISLSISGSYLISVNNKPLNEGKTYLLKAGKGQDGTPVIKIYDGTTEIASGANLSINTINRTDYALFDSHGYLGNFTFTVENESIKIVNTIYLEDYVKCVVPNEVYSSWNKEALKAQAIAARGYAYFHKDEKDFNDTTKFQKYEGIVKLPDSTNAATKETAGQMVTYNGSVIDSLFSASNGGMTENNQNEFGGTLEPYFPIQKDDFDTEYVWNLSIKKQQINTDDLDLSHPETWWDTVKEANPDITAKIKSWLNKNGYSNKEIKIVSIPKLAFNDQTGSGRMIHGDFQVNFFVKDNLDTEGKLQLLTESKTGTADDVRGILGTTIIKSTLINLTETNDSFTIDGAGFGHGVGMSQHGANNRANKGILTKDILAFYYKGTDLSKIYDATDLYELKVQLNGQDFMPGYNKNSTAYLNWKVLQTFNIPYTYNGKGVFVIEGRTVQAYAINGDWYIKWSDVSPGKVQFQTISGGFNFIYNTPLKIQLNGQDFEDGYSKDNAVYLNWTSLKTLKIPYTYKGKGIFDIEGRTVQALAFNGDWYIKWSQLSPGKIQFKKIAGGFNFIYYTPLKIQLNGVVFKEGYLKDNTTYVNWTALKTFNISYSYLGKGVFKIGDQTVQASAINGDWYIKWYQLSPEKITFTQIDGGFNFIFKP